ncbi:NFACT family protein [Candidatus Woesearchaeota archaeon]|nr:NFACT family protein [Candidatus Woesearchaeota archaeon]
MKTEISSLDLHFLVRELKGLEGARVDKIYEQEEDIKDFLFIFHKTGTGKMMLRVKLPSAAYLTEYKSSFPERPPGFCTFLRKYLGNARVKEVRQKGFERILEIVFEVKQKDAKTGAVGSEGEMMDLTLVCELFSKGNMILLSPDGKIKGLLESQSWEARTIRGGAKYEYPPAQTDTPDLSFDDFKKTLGNAKRDSIVKVFAMDLSLGGVYAEELCRRAGIDKNKIDLGAADSKKAYDKLKEMIGENIEANVFEGHVLPIKTGLALTKAYDSFNKALDDVLTDKMHSASEEREAKEKKGKEDKLSVIIRKQEERLAALEKGVADNQRKGELIYEHYTDVKEALDAINADRKKMGWDELKKKYKDHKIIKDIDGKTGKVVVEL